MDTENQPEKVVEPETEKDDVWPNQTPIVEGVVPSSEVPQDPDLFDGDEDSDLEMDDESDSAADEIKQEMADELNVELDKLEETTHYGDGTEKED